MRESSTDLAFELRARAAVCRSYVGAILQALTDPGSTEMGITGYLDRLDSHLIDMDRMLLEWSGAVPADAPIQQGPALHS